MNWRAIRFPVSVRPWQRRHKPRQLSLGITAKTDMAEWNPWAPPNFIAETTDTQLVVIGPNAVPGGNKTYYRLVAVDEQDKRSGPSDYAVAPRPVICSKPSATAKVGEEYKYTVRANRSLGDLSARAKDGGQVNGYFDIERPKFTLTRGPAWLKIDEATGLLHGTPDTPGEFSVAISASIDREVRELDQAALKWGREKVLAVTTERVGTAVQEFTVVVRP